jgi:hypothetical protein
VNGTHSWGLACVTGMPAIKDSSQKQHRASIALPDKSRSQVGICGIGGKSRNCFNVFARIIAYILSIVPINDSLTLLFFKQHFVNYDLYTQNHPVFHQ